MFTIWRGPGAGAKKFLGKICYKLATGQDLSCVWCVRAELRVEAVEVEAERTGRARSFLLKKWLEGKTSGCPQSRELASFPTHAQCQFCMPMIPSLLCGKVSPYTHSLKAGGLRKESQAIVATRCPPGIWELSVLMFNLEVSISSFINKAKYERTRSPMTHMIKKLLQPETENKWLASTVWTMGIWCD